MKIYQGKGKVQNSLPYYTEHSAHCNLRAILFIKELWSKLLFQAKRSGNRIVVGRVFPFHIIVYYFGFKHFEIR